MEDTILCFGMYSLYKGKMSDKQREIIKLKKTVTQDEGISEYIDFAFDYARRNRSDIFVEENDMRLKVILYLKAGIFSGSNKTDFIELLQRVDEYFIFPSDYDKNATLEICLCFNKWLQKE